MVVWVYVVRAKSSTELRGKLGYMCRDLSYPK